VPVVVAVPATQPELSLVVPVALAATALAVAVVAHRRTVRTVAQVAMEAEVS
jgi:hypothetical protein